ncbi:MAG: hypothetical protein MZU84_04390 [Sphingobacterium sp.]|nr:hypothetical protein [Sphingobacterium sp.]
MAEDARPGPGRTRWRGASIPAGDWLNRVSVGIRLYISGPACPALGSDSSVVEQMAMRQYRSRVARVAIVAVAVFGLASLRLRAGSRGPQAPPAGPVRQLSMEDAIGLALAEQPQPAGRAHQPRAAGPRHRPGQDRLDAEPDRSLSTIEPDEPDQRLLLGRDRQADQRERSAPTSAPNQLLPWGANYTVGVGHDRGPSPTASTTARTRRWLANLTFSFTQPLLRNLKIDAARQQLRRQQDEPRDLGHRPAPDRADDGAQREARVLGRQGGRRRAAGRAPVARSRPRSRCATTSPRSRSARWPPSTSSRPRPRWRAATEAVIVAEAAVKRSEDRAAHAHPRHRRTPSYWATHFDLTEQPVFEATAGRRGGGRQDRPREAHGPAAVQEEPRDHRHRTSATSATRRCRT